jgi:hypothetical protein
MYRCEDFTPVTRCGFPCDTSHQWAAMDIDAIPGLECGHEIIIWSGGQRYDLEVRDSGPLSKYAVDWPGVGLLPIIADIPQHIAWFPGLSARAMVVNGTLTRERMKREK